MGENTPQKRTSGEEKKKMDRSVNQFGESLNHSCDLQNYRKFIFPTTETREISILSKSCFSPTFNIPESNDSNTN